MLQKRLLAGFGGFSCYFLLAQKVTKKGPVIEYSPMTEGSLVKLCATVVNCFSSLIIDPGFAIFFSAQSFQYRF